MVCEMSGSSLGVMTHAGCRWSHGDKGVEGMWRGGWMPYANWLWVVMLLNQLVSVENGGETHTVGPTGLLTSCWRCQWVVRRKQGRRLTCGTHKHHLILKQRG